MRRATNDRNNWEKGNSRARPRRFTIAAAGLVLTAWSVGSGVPAAAAMPTHSTGVERPYDPGPQADTTFGAVIVALTGPHPADAVALLPDAFRRDLGYVPPTVDGYPVDPDGDCSSPVHLPDRFTILCATHDFGYDVLRAAAREGTPLGPWARYSLDNMLAERMRADCSSSEGTCAAAAEATRIALAWNSWRQRGGPPVPGESVTEVISTTLERGAEALAETVEGWVNG